MRLEYSEYNTYPQKGRVPKGLFAKDYDAHGVDA